MNHIELKDHWKQIEELLTKRDPKRASQFERCVQYIPCFSTRYYEKTDSPMTHQFRCALKHACPKCMSEDNIIAARRKDFLIMRDAASALGAGPHGELAQVWLLSAKTVERPSGARLTEVLSRSDSRHKPLLVGKWGGEVICAGFRATKRSNSPKSRTHCDLAGFHAIIFAGPEAYLDEGRLLKWMPGLTIERVKGLGAAWQMHLQRWSCSQFAERTPEEIVQTMISGQRSFETIGALRGRKADYQAKLRKARGKSVQVAFFHAAEKVTEVENRTEQWLPLNILKLTNQPLSPNKLEEIMSLIRPQIKDRLVPEEITVDVQAIRKVDLQRQLDLLAKLDAKTDEIKEFQKRILAIFTEDRPTMAPRIQ